MCLDQFGANPLFKPKADAGLSYTARFCPELPEELRVSALELGPFAAARLAILVDLGLADDEIGRYTGLPGKHVSQLRQAWRVAACDQRSLGEGNACRLRD